MLKDTPSMAKNKIRRCLKAILDPHPSVKDIDALWEYFGSYCSYCGNPICRASRKGHMDHAISSSLGGTNAIHSHVLACDRCNGDEKREELWESFLQKKCPSQDVLALRSKRICDWISVQHKSSALSDPDMQVRANAIIDAALESFEKSVADMRKLRREIE